MINDLVKELENEVGKCISCGFCESVCPTLPAAGYNLWKGARGRVILGKELLSTIKDKETINVSDSFYSCLDCQACLYVCPAGVNAGKVSHISKSIIASDTITGNQNPLAKMMARVTMRYMNPLGVREKCADWFKGMKADPDSNDLLYTGNMYQLMAYNKGMDSMRERMGKNLSEKMSSLVSTIPGLMKLTPVKRDEIIGQKMDKTLSNIALLLRKAGISFNYLGEAEPYPGTFIYDLGYLDLFEKYAKKIAKILKDSGAKRIITVDPHTYDLLKNVYPKYVDDFDLDIVHYLDLIDKSSFIGGSDSITYHEPCHFSLRDDAYNRPLETLKTVANVSLPARSGRRTKCCGGPDELIFPELTRKISEDRYRELQETKAEKIVTACPICFSNLNKGPEVIEIGDYLLSKLKN